MGAVFGAALPIFALIGLEFLAARRRVLGPGAVTALNDFVVFLALPALLFAVTANLRARDVAQGGFVFAFTAGSFITFAVSFALDRRRRSRHPLVDRSIEGLGASYPNTGFMGIPLCGLAFGARGLPGAVIAAVITTCVLFAAAVILIECGLAPRGDRARAIRRVVRSLGRNPLLVAPALGLAAAASGLALPSPLIRFVHLLGGAASPCALVTIGLFLAEQTDQPADRAVVRRLVLLKLVGQPAITALIAYAVLRLPPLAAREVVLLSALPTGTGPFMLARLHGRDAAVTSRVILFSTVGSVLTVSLLLALPV